MTKMRCNAIASGSLPVITSEKEIDTIEIKKVVKIYAGYENIAF